MSYIINPEKQKLICDDYTKKPRKLCDLARDYGVHPQTVASLLIRKKLRKPYSSRDLIHKKNSEGTIPDNFIFKDGTVLIPYRDRTIKIDLLSFDFFMNKKWYVCNSGKRSTHQYVRERGGELLHRQLICAGPKVLVDHKNRDPFDNRLSNLRIATYKQNSCNSKVSSRNKLGIKGIYLCGKIKFTSYYVQLGDKVKYGPFKSLNEAKMTYNKKAKELYGEFAYQHEL